MTKRQPGCCSWCCARSAASGRCRHANGRRQDAVRRHVRRTVHRRVEGSTATDPPHRIPDRPQRIRDMGGQHMPGDEAWLIGERRATGEHKYYLSNLPTDTPITVLASTIKARWICEQAHQQLKEELGLDHFEGRSWHGLHRHALMTMIAYAFLQHHRLATARREKKNQWTATTTKLARRASSYHHSHHSRAASALSALPQMVQLGIAP